MNWNRSAAKTDRTHKRGDTIATTIPGSRQLQFLGAAGVFLATPEALKAAEALSDAQAYMLLCDVYAGTGIGVLKYGRTLTNIILADTVFAEAHIKGEK